MTRVLSGLFRSNSAKFTANQALFDLLCSRRSVSPKRLVPPGPTAYEIEKMVQAATHSPDHAGIQPWRFIEIPGDTRQFVAEIFVKHKKLAQDIVDTEIIARERDKACSAPTLIVVCACLQPEHPRVPITEQFVSIGAAIQNFLLCAHILGYGGIILSGDRVRIPTLGAALGLSENEAVVGFLSLGTTSSSPPIKSRATPKTLYQVWQADKIRA